MLTHPRSSQKKPGPVGKTAERARYVELAKKGLNNSEICRMLGIGRKTGSNWRHGHRIRDPKTGKVYQYPPIATIVPTPISTRYLSEDERVRIGDLRAAGLTIRAIAAELGRAPSTISRELKRNASPAGRYQPFRAHKLAAQRRPRPKAGKIAANTTLRERIVALMLKRWSPGQIARQLRNEFPGDAASQVVHETIYQAIYTGRAGLTSAKLPPLRTGRRRRKPSRKIPRRRSRFAGDVLMISDRPLEVADRKIAGHWEGDLIMGRHNRTAIGTLVERTTRFLILVPVDAATRSDSLRDGLIASLGALPPQLRRSLTWDQGWEMSKHAEFSTATAAPVYFCDPHSPWQRGSNENMNGLLRDYFPKGSDLGIHSPKRLAQVAAEINDRPRAVLNWATPASRFSTLLTNPQ